MVNQFENSNSIEEFEKLKKDFKNLNPFKDSEHYISECKNKINEILLKEKNELYDKLVNQFENSSTIEEFEKLKKYFQNLGPFNDSEQYVLKCENKIKKITSRANVVICISALLFFIVIFLIDLYSKYNSALDLFNAKKYEEAIAKFEEIKDFKDSSDKIKECEIGIKSVKYDIAIKLFNEKKYEEAIPKFNEIIDFKDSRDKIKECEFGIKNAKYEIALNLFNAKKYEEAIHKFEQIKSFKDSGDKIKECEFGVKNVKYDIALNLLNEKKYEEAIPKFEEIKEFKDSIDKIKECEIGIKTAKYEIALNLFSEKKYDEAISKFEEIKGFNDSSDKIKECEIAVKYDMAIKLFKEKNYDESIAKLEQIKDFKDSIDIIKECETAIKNSRYDMALDLYNEKKYEEALPIFEQIKDFKDSGNKIKECEIEVKYDMALNLFKAKRYEEAIPKFEKIKDFKDSRNKIKECENFIKDVKYNMAMNLFNSKKYEEALFIFEQIKDYKDSSRKVNECKITVKYDMALKLYNEKKYDEALQIFEQINDYKDSSSKIKEIINKPFDNFLKSFEIKMVVCPSGKFTMGSPQNEKGRNDDEIQHTVVISKPFAIGKYEVTQAQYGKSCSRSNYHLSIPPIFKGENCPAILISWDDAKSFCDNLNRKFASQLPKGYRFDLPTEAQWEYACRAGTITALNNGKDLTSEIDICYNLDEIAWYRENSGSGCIPHPVGQKKPNAWGIYDMHGNVQEWCRDRYGDYPKGNVIDPIGPSTGSRRVIRG